MSHLPRRDPIQRVLDAVQAGGLLPAGQPVVVMLSGGRDSVCLLDVAVRLAGTDVVRALHVNYGLRAGAVDDERHCARLCEQVGVELRVERPSDPPRGNLQGWARDLRYGAAVRMAAPRGARIAVGHTASDQAETVLYRLAASPGRRALLGMSSRDGDVVRPLLSVTREDTAAYCRAQGLEWRDDETNDSSLYARGRVRHELLPVLRSIHPHAEANVLGTAALLREEAEVLDAVVDAVLGGEDSVEVERLRALPPALRRLVLRRLAEDAADRLVPEAATRADELLALGDRPGSATVDLGEGLRAIAEYGRLRFSDHPPGAAPGEVGLTVPGSVRFGPYLVSCRRGPAERRDGVLDASAVGDRLLVRSWRPGDRMAPLGAGGTRTLQDLFTDRRVPRERRGELPVVLAGEEIAWVPGVATGERFRVRPDTSDAVHLTARTPA
jgi:tRNA(Ile)-lysidine synthase